MSINNSGYGEQVRTEEAPDSVAVADRPAPQPVQRAHDETSRDSAQWSGLRSTTAGLRDRARILGTDTEELHREVQSYDLNDRASLKARAGVPALLSELADERGLAWSDIATGIGVSLSAVRKWRTGGTCTPANRTALARLAALLDLAEEACISDPGSWLLTEVEHGYTPRYLDVIAAGRETLVLDCAFQRRTGKEVLDEFKPDWRETTARRFDVVVDEDGVRSLRPL